MKVFCFDRDHTVSVSFGPVPLEWVRLLAHRTEHEVWATGNQQLKTEAEIPGVAEARERTGDDRHLQENRRHAGYLTRRARVRLVGGLFPDAEEHVIVDDVDLSGLESEGWSYYHPDDFVTHYAGRTVGGVRLEYPVDDRSV